jgi:hypothetical protein
LRNSELGVQEGAVDIDRQQANRRRH